LAIIQAHRIVFIASDNRVRGSLNNHVTIASVFFTNAASIFSQEETLAIEPLANGILGQLNARAHTTFFISRPPIASIMRWQSTSIVVVSVTGGFHPG
jgi:hypothetical protein